MSKPWIGESEAHRKLLELISRVALKDVELLFLGETGVGKEHYARFAHRCSPRNTGPFVPVNCGSIPSELFENELFGHVGGAFTGAKPRSNGLVAAAGGGTLFLDEVDALAPTNQVKVLRLLQEKEYRRLGEATAQRANARVVSATNCDLVHAARTGRFREDLLFRLRVVPIEVPPLRDRRDDILPMLDAFIAHYATEYALEPIQPTLEARRALRDYDWPGNVRELENVVRNLTCVQDDCVVHVHQLPLLFDAKPSRPSGSFHKAKSALVSEFERKYLEDALTASNGNIAHAARTAGKPRRAFFELMRKHGITSGSRRLG
jgi:DNA-binding NtrC family response regulator